MPTTHFDALTQVLVEALGDRLAPGVSTFAELFREDGVLKSPFDGDGSTPPIISKSAINAMVESLAGTINFESAGLDTVHFGPDEHTVIGEYHSTFTMGPTHARFDRRYVAIATVHDGQIAELREYGGPLMPVK